MEGMDVVIEDVPVSAQCSTLVIEYLRIIDENEVNQDHLYDLCPSFRFTSFFNSRECWNILGMQTLNRDQSPAPKNRKKY